MNIKKKTNSITFKTLFYLVTFSISILLLLWFFQAIFLSVSYERFQIKNLNKIASTIHNVSDESLLETIEQIAYEQEVCIEFVSPYKTMSYNTRLIGCELGKNNKNIIEYQTEMIENNEAMQAFRLVNQEFKANAFLYGIQKTSGYVFVYNTLEDLSNASIVLKGQLIYLTVIAIIFACIIAYFLSHKITKPILDITEKAKKLGTGNHDIIFEQNGILEIDELAESLNMAQEELSKTDELRRDLLANVSHDLKTPLTMIKAYAEMIRDISYKSDDKREEHLNIIISETDRLNILVNDLLSLSKMQADADTLKMEEFDLTKEIHGIIKKYEIMKELENYNFVVEMPKEAIVYADKNKLNQVIYNLINNAINYTGKDKLVTIRIIEEKSKYLVEIVDTGKGIKPEEIKLIWNKYYKNEKNHKRNVVGTGIGLSIVKTILEHHHFEYGVRSKKNVGTTFYFKINKNKKKK
ncbi:MAG: HAMP domain-containing histidine kinase [Bacilli bacterium]|nr:HAMP domain-containing histidine kinase [Bacilli bacterium]